MPVHYRHKKLVQLPSVHCIYAKALLDGSCRLGKVLWDH